ncbi:hypothetical protein BGI32_04720 [Snodgrassella alvi]|uniref:Uncharacterized protein n=1 Tax=Snodgrassella alvi TaxID=1196083 RepID=A0A2N9WUR0_9NEIS|nr:SIR2 family protein [Snodgrassella alvi]PIT16440.1 hypothetical protein BGI32_04720 [Snodgrassella alvi]
MCEKINLLDVYNKNLNILIGSGASAGLFPTLALGIKDENEEKQTIETLATKYASLPKKQTTLFMHYYNKCIFPVQTFNPNSVISDDGIKTLKNYETFLTTLLNLLDRKKKYDRKINIFTTNYDGCLVSAADRLLQKGANEFVVNDGTSGFYTKCLHPKNFSTFQYQTGIFGHSKYVIPQINIIHLHGSVYWLKNDERIEVKYQNSFENILNHDNLHIDMNRLNEYSDFLSSETNSIENIPELDLTDETIKDFWNKYNKLPIVNPTKWKFHETVFEEHYYQMLRQLSYELEKPNSILITFGFSFADEHILRLVQRSLSNPQLQTFICCYTVDKAINMREKFSQWRNVSIIEPAGGKNLDFTYFNEEVFNESIEQP